MRSWEGEKNSIDSSKVGERRKRKGRDDWDRELDRGKVRKCCMCTCVHMGARLLDYLSADYMYISQGNAWSIAGLYSLILRYY